MLNGLEINFKSYLGSDYEKKKSAPNVMPVYKGFLEDKAVFGVYFDITNENGDMVAYDKDVKIILENAEIGGMPYNTYYRASKLIRQYNVIVLRCDEENGIVYVSHEKAKLDDKTKALEYIKLCLREDEPCIMPAKAVSVFEKCVIVDIGGLGIPGLITSREWAVQYTQDIRVHMKKGEVLKVQLLKRDANKNEMRYFKWSSQEPFVCSRRLLQGDPWTAMADRVHKGDVVKATCILKKEDYFFGRISGIEEVDALCSYPPSGHSLSKADIQTGFMYECYVQNVNTEKRILRVKPFKRLDII